MRKMILAAVAVAGLTLTAGENFANAQSMSHQAPPEQGQQQNNWSGNGG